jgi:hypothetical protein
VRIASLALITAALATRTAHADDAAPAPAPMTPVADLAAVCRELRDDLDATVACKRVAGARLAGGATVEIHAVVDERIRYAVVVTAGGKLAMSTPVELSPSDCGMMKCDILEQHKPSLRVVRGGAVALLEITARYHHEQHDPESSKPRSTITERWRAYDYVACGKASSGALTCLARHHGDRGHSCTGRVTGADVTLTCDDVEPLLLD